MVTSRPTPSMAARHLVPQPGARDVPGTGDQHREGQAAADDDLLDVEEFDLVFGQHLEQRRRDTWLIDSGDGDEHRHP